MSTLPALSAPAVAPSHAAVPFVTRSTLYHLTGALAEAEAVLVEAGGAFEDDEHAIAFDALFDTVEDKLEATHHVLLSLAEKASIYAADAARVQAEADRLKKLAAAHDKGVETLKARLGEALVRLGRKRQDTRFGRITQTTTPARVEVAVPVDDLPEAFRRTKTETRADLVALGAALKGGDEAAQQVARLVPGRTTVRLA